MHDAVIGILITIFIGGGCLLFNAPVVPEDPNKSDPLAFHRKDKYKNLKTKK